MTVALIVLGFVVFAQKTVPPAVVANAFKSRFSGATNVSWGKESKTEYEAEFTWNGKKYSANFAADGKWVETESPVAASELPAPVLNAYKSAHKSAPIKMAAKIETATGKQTYEIEYKQGAKTKEAFYDQNGNATKGE